MLLNMKKLNISLLKFKEHYLSSDYQKGFIEWRLQAIRIHLHPSEKKYKKNDAKRTSKIQPKPLNTCDVENLNNEVY